MSGLSWNKWVLRGSALLDGCSQQPGLENRLSSCSHRVSSMETCALMHFYKLEKYHSYDRPALRCIKGDWRYIALNGTRYTLWPPYRVLMTLTLSRIQISIFGLLRNVWVNIKIGRSEE